MKINDYGRQLLPEEIEADEHREFVGGLWDELGLLQFEFLRSQGLQPHHRLIDVGCGALRGGIHFIRYLEPGGYHGIDVNASLIAAGERELKRAQLDGKGARLLVTNRFELGSFGTSFDFALAVSLFTHLPMNHIVRALCNVRGVLRPGAPFYASYFEAPGKACLQPLDHSRGGVVTHYDDDPYHYAFEEIQYLASIADMQVERIGEWGHPRDQMMLSFSRGG